MELFKLAICILLLLIFNLIQKNSKVVLHLSKMSQELLTPLLNCAEEIRKVKVRQLAHAPTGTYPNCRLPQLAHRLELKFHIKDH